jgi:hypothetical protein
MGKNEIYKKCSLEITPCIWVKFKGDTTNKSFPQLPEDSGLASDFLRWCLDEKIYSIDGTPGTSGPGIISLAYPSNKAKKIFKWFKDKGVNCEMSKM